jgi:PKD repeat protein
MKLFLKLIKITCIVVTIMLHKYDYAQSSLKISVSSTENKICNGKNCVYNGPTILINEVQTSPENYNGSIWEPNPYSSDRCGEWIELYNPHLCEAVDISFYFLGNNAKDGYLSTNYGGGFLIPANTIVPPRGFCLIRGVYAPHVAPELLVKNGGNTIELTVDDTLVKTCIDSGIRLWFPDNGGWFAFYDRNGVPQDAISWGTIGNSCMNCPPCTPSGSPYFTGILPSYDSIPNDRKTYVYAPVRVPASDNYTMQRISDGGNWLIDSLFPPTMGGCNDTCIEYPKGLCTGTATVNVSGGVPPFRYLWNDTELQQTSTAVRLCGGIYTVIVIDSQNDSATTSIEVFNYEISADFTYAPEQPYMTADEVHFKYTGDYASSFFWNFGDETTSNEENPTHTYYTSGKLLVSLFVEDTNQCKGQIEHEIIVYERLKFPNILTPIGTDGKRYYFRPLDRLGYFKEFEIRIFNRWGNLVWTNYCNEPNCPDYLNDDFWWDGTNKHGNDVSDGVYFWVVQASPLSEIPPFIQNGSVTVVR